MTTPNIRLAVIFTIIAILLSVPLIAMQFTQEVDWSLFDFMVMTVLLSGLGLLIELVLRKVKTLRNRLALCALVLLSGFLIWAELAVGIFGTPLAGS